MTPKTISFNNFSLVRFQADLKMVYIWTIKAQHELTVTFWYTFKLCLSNWETVIFHRLLVHETSTNQPLCFSFYRQSCEKLWSKMLKSAAASLKTKRHHRPRTTMSTPNFVRHKDTQVTQAAISFLWSWLQKWSPYIENNGWVLKKFTVNNNSNFKG